MGGGGWIKPLQTLSQGLVLTLRSLLALSLTKTCDDDELEQLKTLHDLKSRGSDRFSPQESPQFRKPVARCQTCNFDFTSKDVLDKHIFQHHRVQNSGSASNRPKNDNPNVPQHEKVISNSIPVVASSRDVAQCKPDGTNIRRQYNCHECDFQTNKSKFLFNHSVRSGHRKIDSLTETCFTCKQTFENFIVLMKHRKSAHYDLINECHGFKTGSCKFGESCYYKHSGGQAESKTSSNNTVDDSFHQGLSEFPPDLKELTLGFQQLMSTFLSRRESFRSRQSGH